MRRDVAVAVNAGRMRRARGVMVLALTAAALLAAPPVALGQGDQSVAAASDPILQQLAAFRRDDYDAAYEFASSQIRDRFDRTAFERMVKSGYPEIARSTFAAVAEARLVTKDHAIVRVKIQGANGKGIEALYDMVLEDRGWRIDGVVARPDPGQV